MSKVDERIVEMKFENQGFEKNVDSSISALERLKSALNFKGAEKSIADVEKSVNGVDFSKLSASVDALSSRFSAWGIAGMTVIQDLTHAAENLGKQLFNATVGQIKRGGWSRATNIDQAKFMLEGLGVQWADIKDDIDYGVADTAYGMDAAAKAASQLKASGVELGDEMKSSLRAISGVAAMTNSSYEEISPIFTTIAGQGKVMTMQLRQLETRGLNVAAELGKQMGKTEEEIRDMVTKGKIGFKEFSDAMDAAYGEHAKEANKTFEGSMSNLKSALSRIGQNFAAPIRSNMIGIFNSLREIVNTINKSKLGQVYKDFEDFAAKASNFVQNVLNNIDLSFIDGFVDKLHEAYLWFDTIMTEINPLWKNVAKEEEKAAEATEKNTEAAKDYEEVVKRVLNGEYGNGEERYKQLEAEGYNWKIVQNMINEAEGSSKRYEVSEEEMNAAMSKTNATIKEREQIESSGRKASRKAYTEWMEEQKRKAGAESKGHKASREAYEEYAKQQRKAVKEQERAANRQATINSLLNKLTPVAQGVASAFNIIKNTISAVIEGAIDPAIRIFGALGSIVLDVLGYFGLGITALDESMSEADSYAGITETVNKALSGVADVLETIAGIVTDLTSGTSLSDVINGLFGDGSDVENAVSVGDSLSGVLSNIKEFFETIKGYFTGDLNISFGELINRLTGLFPILSKLFPAALEVVKGALIFKGTKALGGLFDTIASVPKAINASINEKNSQSLLRLAEAIGILAIAFFALASLSWDQIGRGAAAIGAIALALGGLFAIMSKLSKGDKDNPLGFIDTFSKSIANKNNSTAILKVAAAFAILSAALLGLAQLTWDQFFVGAAAIGVITAALAAFMLVIGHNKKNASLIKLSNPIDSLRVALADLGKAAKSFLNKVGTALLIGAIAAAIFAIGQTVATLADIPWQDSLKACGFVALIMLEIVGAIAILNKVSQKGNHGFSGEPAATMYALGVVIGQIGDVIKKLSRISLKSGLRACGLLGLILLEFALSVKALSSLSKREANSIGTIALLATVTLVAKSIGGILESLSKIDLTGGLKACALLGIVLLELGVAVSELSGLAEREANAVGTALLLGVLALVISSIKNTIIELTSIKWEDGVAACSLMGIALVELGLAIAALSKLSKRKAGAVGTSLLMGTLALVIASLGDTITKLSELNFDKGLKACKLIGVLLLELVGTLALVSLLGGKHTSGFGIFLAGFALAMKAMASSVSQIAALDTNSIDKAIGAIAKISILIAGLLVAARFTGGTKTSIKGILPVILLLGALTAALYVITTADQTALTKSTRALTKIVMSLSLLMVALSKLNGGNIKIAPILSIIGVIATVVGAMYILTQLDTGAVANAGTALTKVFAGVAAMLAATSLITKHSTSDADIGAVLASIAGVAILVAEVSGALALLTLLPEDQIGKLNTVAESLKEVLGGVAAVALAISVADILKGDSDDGGLSDLGAAGDVADMAAGAGKTAGVAKIIAIVSGIMLFLGWLDGVLGDDLFGSGKSLLENLSDAIGAWEEPLTTLGTTIGSLFGGLARGVVKGFTGEDPNDIIKGFVDEIKNFPETLDKWISGLSDVASTLKEKTSNGEFDDLDLGGAKEFMETMSEIADDILNIAQDFYHMQSNLGVAYGNEAKKISAGANITIGVEDLEFLFTSWASALMSFSNALTAGGFNKEAANGAITTASDILSSFSGLLGNVKDIGGDTNFEALTNTIEALPQFASALVKYSWAMVFLNGGAVTATEDAVKLINALSGEGIKNGISNVSVDNGLIGWFGKNGTALETYSKDLPTYAGALVDYAKAIDGMQDYTDAVSDTRVAVSIINELAGAAIDTGLKSILGVGNDMSYIPVISSYSGELESFAGGMVAYSKAITGLNPLAVLLTSGAVEMINALASAAPNVNYDSGLFGFLKNGGNKLKDLGLNLGGFGSGLATFSQNIGGGQFDAGAVYNTSGAIKYLIDTLAELNTLALGGNGQEGLNTFDTDIALSTLDGFIETVADHFTDEGVLGDVETIKGAGRGIVQNFMQGIVDGFSEGFDTVPIGAGEGAVNLADKLVNAILGKSPKDGFEKATTRGKGVINAFFNGATEGIEGDGKAAFAESLTAAIESIFTATEESGASYRASGVSFMTNLAAGIRGGASWPKTAAYSVLTTTVASIKSSGFQQFGAVGRYWMQGLKKGIEVEAASVKAYLVNKANEMVEAFKAATKVESPSKVFSEIGGYWMQGLANGINAEANSPLSALERVASSSFDTMEDNMSALAEQAASSLAAAYLYINQVVQDSMNANPVITPVLDLSMMQNGLYAMNGMMPGSYGYNPLAYSMNAFPGSYSYGYSQQAMGQSNLEAELRGLRSDVKVLGEAMTTMGITLDSGVMVGALTPGTDRELGNITKFKERWA